MLIKGNVCLCRRHKGVWDSGVVALLILNLGHQLRWVIRFMLRSFCPRGNCTALPISIKKGRFNLTDSMSSWTRQRFPFIRFNFKLKSTRCFTMLYVRFQALSQNCEKLLLALWCPSVRSHGTTRLSLEGLWINLMFRFFFQSLSRKLKVSLNSDKNNGYFTRRHFYIYDNISLNSS